MRIARFGLGTSASVLRFASLRQDPKMFQQLARIQHPHIVPPVNQSTATSGVHSSDSERLG